MRVEGRGGAGGAVSPEMALFGKQGLPAGSLPFTAAWSWTFSLLCCVVLWCGVVVVVFHTPT